MIILQTITIIILLSIIAIISAAAYKLVQYHKKLHNKIDNSDEDTNLDLPKTL